MTMTTDNNTDGGFLSRWSRRKAQVRQGADSPTASPGQTAPQGPAVGAAVMPRSAAVAVSGVGTAATTGLAPAGSAASAAPAAAAGSPPVPPSATEAVPARPRPTLDDVEQLNAASDYRAFVARDVDPDVRNAAFKKLFHSDPHFNVMDGLDVYIDDYNTPQPLPLAIMKTLVQARALGLIDDELKDQDLPPPDGPAAAHDGEVQDSTVTSEDARAQPTASEETLEEAQDAASLQPSAMASGKNQADKEHDSGEQQAIREGGAQIVHVMHVVPAEPIAAVSVSTVAPAAPVAAGIVVPFPRRPGSADPT